MTLLRPQDNVPARIAPMPPAYGIVGRAAAGASVALYTCTIDSHIAGATLTVLRDFASAQGWTSVLEAYDLAPLTTPRNRRTGWRTVEDALTRGEATGFIAPSEQEIASHPADWTALRCWLIDLPAFAVYPGRRTAPQTPPPCGPTRTPSFRSACGRWRERHAPT